MPSKNLVDKQAKSATKQNNKSDFFLTNKVLMTIALLINSNDHTIQKVQIFQ